MRWGIWMALCVWGCGGEAAPGTASGSALAPAQAAEGEVVLARVDGQLVTARQVRDVVEETGLAPREALRRLLDERLLANAASERGYAAQDVVREAARNAAVHALLARRVESEVDTDALPAAEVTRRAEALAKARSLPERRVAEHVLVRLPEQVDPALDERARRLAEEAAQALRGAPDPQRVLDRYERQPTVEGLVVLVERLPPTAEDGRFARPFEQALFALDGEGSVSPAVRTSFGWHAIRLREVLDAHDVEPSEVEEEVRQAMLTERRRRRLSALMERLAAATSVEVFDEAVPDALSFDEGLP